MNALLDKDFLKELDNFNSKEVYARITALTMDELPIEMIEGKITGGNCNIDGTSAIRRTCSLSLVAEDVNINDFYWGLNSKFKLEAGLKNFINPIYPDIIWFPLGTYISNSFNTSTSPSNFNISISGKDKMCLLNGEVGGSLPASIDFGVEEIIDGDVVVRKKIPIKKIIREMLHTYALEPYENIVINDLEDKGLELLEYRGDTPLYLLQNIKLNEYTGMEFDGNKEYINKESGEKVSLNNLKYNDRVDDLFNDENDATVIVSKETGEEFIVSKIEYGQTVGYRLTDLTYAGDLISSIGESITSILDKIVKMLGNFEYFYDTYGRFIFQTKKTYINTSWNPIVKSDEDMYVENSSYTDSNAYHFDGNNLISSFSNAPNLNNIRNDFSIWGTRKTINGAEIPIHYRYAIHNKPVYYKSFDNIVYTIDDYDWREIIYQMALDYYKHNQEDDFQIKLIQNNLDYYPNGTTGYEQFYVDLQGFWRQLYNPNPEINYEEYYYERSNKDKTFEPLDEQKNEIKDLFVKENYQQLSIESEVDRSKVYILKDYGSGYELQKLIDTIPVIFFNEKGEWIKEHPYCITDGSEVGYKLITENIYDKIEKKEIYVRTIQEDGKSKYTHILDTVDLNENCYLKIALGKDEYLNVKDLPEDIQKLYFNEEGFNKYYTISQLGLDGEVIKGAEKIYNYFDYYIQVYDYIREEDGDEYLYWNKKTKENPDLLNFWIDFLDADIGKEEESELSKYAISAIGDRPKVVNDSDVKSIYYRNVPNLIFTTNILNVDFKDKTGYVFMQLNEDMNLNYFTISAQGKSAKNELDELLYQHSYFTESINITAIPIYYLQPNTRISVRDDLSNINGEYIINRLSFSLAYNGQMSIQATKTPQRFN